MLENLSSDDCKVKKEFIPNAELIISLSKTVTTLLDFIDSLMPKAKSSNNKNKKYMELAQQQRDFEKEMKTLSGTLTGLIARGIKQT